MPADDEASSLSAILLDDEYYMLIMNNRTLIDGITIVPPSILIVLKAKAWMDLKRRRDAGEAIDNKNISKHKNDIARLAQIVVSKPVEMSELIHDEMEDFLLNYSHEIIDVKALKIPMTQEEIFETLSVLFRH